MANRKYWIIAIVVCSLIAVAGIGVLLSWIILRTRPEFEIIYLNGPGIGDVEQEHAYTRLRRGAHIFWSFYPTTSSIDGESRPIILWLDGLLGISPSLLANFGMVGPYDPNLNRREDSWINDYNLLFVDAPVGTGFSFYNQPSQLVNTPEDYADDLFYTLQSFYSIHEEYQNRSLFIIGQGQGAKQALTLTTRLQEQLQENEIEINLEGIILGGAIISPALVLSKLGFYLEELGYIDNNGRDFVEEMASETLALVNEQKYEEAFSNFISLQESVNEGAGAVAVNIYHIVEKLTRQSGPSGQKNLLESRYSISDIQKFMENTVAPAVGITGRVSYDALHNDVLNAAKSTFMISDIEKVENILQNTNITVHIYNGNLDAISNTPGQLEWVNNLRWDGQSAFLASPRNLLVVNSLLEGYVRETEQLHFYWVNAAGHSAPLDNPVAMREILRRVAGY